MIKLKVWELELCIKSWVKFVFFLCLGWRVRAHRTRNKYLYTGSWFVSSQRLQTEGSGLCRHNKVKFTRQRFLGTIRVVIVLYLNLQLLVQSVPITTKFVSSNPIYGEVYSIQHYVIKFISGLWLVGGFLWVFRFLPPIKLTAMI